MPSLANAEYLEVLLADATELGSAHARLSTRQRGRQWGLGALNRAVVVLCVSAWEAYLEELLKEAVEAIHPGAPPLGTWPAVKAQALSDIGRFNNPNVENAVKLFASNIGIADITSTWGWRNCSRERARSYLNDALRQRHHIAHGVNPRPVVHNAYSGWLPDFFKNLGRCTDQAVLNHLTGVLGVTAPW